MTMVITCSQYWSRPPSDRRWWWIWKLQVELWKHNNKYSLWEPAKFSWGYGLLIVVLTSAVDIEWRVLLSCCYYCTVHTVLLGYTTWGVLLVYVYCCWAERVQKKPNNNIRVIILLFVLFLSVQEINSITSTLDTIVHWSSSSPTLLNCGGHKE